MLDENTLKILPNNFNLQKEKAGSQKGSITCSRSNGPEPEPGYPSSYSHLPFTKGELLLYLMFSSVFFEFTHDYGTTRSPLHLSHKNAGSVNQLLPSCSCLPLILQYWASLPPATAAPTPQSVPCGSSLGHSLQSGRGQAGRGETGSSQGRIWNSETFWWHVCTKSARK